MISEEANSRNNSRRSSAVAILADDDEENAESKKKKRHRRKKKKDQQEDTNKPAKKKERKRPENKDPDGDIIVRNPINQFKNQERATQTPNKIQKSIEIQTEPPQKINFSALVNQWKIYDRYQAYEAAKDIADRVEEHKKVEPRRFFEQEMESFKEIENRKMIRCGRILERMVNQNNCNDISLGWYYHLF